MPSRSLENGRERLYIEVKLAGVPERGPGAE